MQTFCDIMNFCLVMLMIPVVLIMVVMIGVVWVMIFDFVREYKKH